ncbi:hypothetical protein TNCV_3140891 [Trichonephila clavipes]|nr:hypothetical protein TNCV_3140891 [Trichonephila clavipes]
MSAETGEYFPPLQFTCRNCGGGDRCRVAIYRPFGEFRRAKSYCHLYGAQSQRGVPLVHATMNFVGFDLTTCDVRFQGGVVPSQSLNLDGRKKTELEWRYHDNFTLVSII